MALDGGLRAQLLNLPSAAIADGLMRLGVEPRATQGIRPTIPYRKFVGSAWTVDVEPAAAPLVAGELVGTGIVPALEGFGAQRRGPGWVLALAAPRADRAMVGEGMCMIARSLGMSAILTDGPVRDSHEARGTDFPVFSRGFSPLGPYNALRVGATDVPVTVGGIEIRPGDVLVGDHDGVLAFEPALVVELLDAARAASAHSAQVQGDVARRLAGGGRTGELT